MSASSTLKFLIYGEDKTASKAIKGVGQQADTTHGKLSKLGAVGSGALATGVGAAAAAAGVLAWQLADAAKGAIEDEAGQARLAKALENTTGASDKTISSVESWIARTGEATGVTDDQMRPAMERLARSTKDVGEAQDLMRVAMDTSAGTGKSLESVAAALAKAHDGNAGALGRLGIQTKDAEGKTLSFDQIMKNLSTTFGGQMAEKADTLGGRIGRLKLQFDEAKEAVGARLLPVIEKLVTWFQDKALPVLGKMASEVAPKLRDAFDGIKRTIEENRPGLETLGQMLAAVAGVIVTEVVPVLVELWEHHLRMIIKVLAEVGEAIPGLASAFFRFAADATRAFGSVLDAATTAFSGILTVAEKGLGWIPGIGDKIKGAKQAFDEFRSDAQAKLAGVAKSLEAAAGKVDEWNAKAKSAATARIKGEIEDLKEKIADAKERLKDPKLTEPEKSKIRGEISDLQEKLKTARADLATIKDKEVTVSVKFKQSGGKMNVSVDAGPTKEGGAGGGPPAGDVKSASGSVARANATTTNRVGTCLATVSRWVGGPHGVPKAIDAWHLGRNKHRGDYNPPAGVPVFWSGGTAGHVALSVGGGKARSTDFRNGSYSPGLTGTGSIHDIGRAMGKQYLGWTSDAWGKALAAGGIVRARPGGMRAVIGEAGQDEAVIPLPAGWSADRIGGDTIIINVSGGLGDREQVARDVKLALLDLKRRSGGQLLGIG